MKTLFTTLFLLLIKISFFQAQNIIITEINYNGPESGIDSTEFIELYNNTNAAINLNGYSFSSGITHTFGNKIINSGEYFVVGTDSSAIRKTFNVSIQDQWTSGGLSNAGEPITLKDNLGVTIDSLRYDDSAPWPNSPDGNGPTLRLCDITSDNTDGNNWSASTEIVTGRIVNGKQIYGSPSSAANCPTACTDPTLAILSHSSAPICEDSSVTLNINGTLNDATEWTIYTGSCGDVLVGATTSSTFEVTPTGASTTYFVRGEGGCVTHGSCASITVNTTAKDDASFSYSNTEYCQFSGDNSTPTITGLNGGTFTSSSNNLSINTNTGEVDLSGPGGTYDISYLTNGSCPNTFTQSITINESNIGFDVISECDSLVWIDGITYYESNNSATMMITNQAGCDSLVTLNLTINKSDTVIDTQVQCDTYTWIDGNTYTSNNNSAQFTLQNQKGCDSVIKLDLTINNSTTGTDSYIRCGSLTWIDGNTYTTSNNTAQFILTNSAGCD